MRPTKRIYPARNTLGVLTVSGGAGVLISDAAEAAGVAMPPMPEDAQAQAARAGALLRAAQPGGLHRAGHQRPAADRPKFADSVARDGGYTSILAFWSQTAAGRSVGPQPARADAGGARGAIPDRLWVMSMLAPNKVRGLRGGWLAGVRGPGARGGRHRGHGPLRRRLRRGGGAGRAPGPAAGDPARAHALRSGGEGAAGRGRRAAGAGTRGAGQRGGGRGGGGRSAIRW